MARCSCETWIWILPIIITVAVPITFFVSYGLAVSKKHVAPVWPYISDTGTLPPESCIFGQLLNLGAFLLFFIMYFRYRQIRVWIESSTISISHCANKCSFAFAIVSCLGLDIVANFQESNVLAVHLFGAITCFVAGTIYCIFQTVFTRMLNSRAKVLFIIRIILASISVCATVGALAPVKAAVTAFDGDNVLHWGPEHKGYSFHILSTSMEWILVFSFCFFIGTLCWDFRNVKVSEPGVKVLNIPGVSSRAYLSASYKA